MKTVQGQAYFGGDKQPPGFVNETYKYFSTESEGGYQLREEILLVEGGQPISEKNSEGL